MIYTLWKTLLVLALSTGTAETTLEFESAEACQQVQEALVAQGLDAGECFASSVWGRVGPDGYDPLEGEFSF